MIGRTLLHYEIIAELGAGAMGRVYLARDTRTDRRVALKFLAADAIPDGEAHERLVREARATSRLSHPGIVTLFSLEEAEGQLFLVEEFVEGETLAKRLERAPLGISECVRLARELTAALAHAHRQGVLHRDLKPENVLITAVGSYKIADFGIARLEGASPLTRTGTVLGSLAYLAPERLRGNAGDARSDLFALGATLYQAMSGKRAFSGGTEAEVMYAVMNLEPARLEASGPIAGTLASMVAQLLEKEPQRRPASAEVVAGILAGLEAPMPARGTRRTPWWIPAVAVLVLLAIGAVLMWTRMRRAREADADEPAVAVLYFENIADPEDRARIGSITGNLLITSFAQTPELNVLSTQRVLDAMRQVGRGGRMVDRGVAREVAKRAHARRIVTGSILQTEPEIVMTAEVSDVETGKVLDAARVVGSPGQTVFQVVDALSERLMQKMTRAPESARLQPVARRTSTDLEAQRRYTEGLELLSRGQLNQAMRSFQGALERDPQFAQAQYQLAIVQWWQLEPADAAENLEKARRLADQLSPLEREVVEGLGQLVNQDYAGAQKRFDRLEQLYPDEKLVHYGQVEASFHGGDFSRAVNAARKALAIDPDFTLAGVHLVDALMAERRITEADSTARSLLRRDPQNNLLWDSYGVAALERGDADGAVHIARDAFAHGAPITTLRFASLLVLNRSGAAAASSWMPRGLPAWQAADIALGESYHLALRAGRFREAVRIARRSWRLPNLIHPGELGVPLAVGWQAAATMGDSIATMAFVDSMCVRLTRDFGASDSLSRALLRVEALTRLGRISAAETLLERLESWPDAGRGTNPGVINLERALLRHAEHRDHEAIDLLGRSVWDGPGWRGFGMMRLYRIQFELGADRASAVVPQVDSLLRVPMLLPDDAVRLYFYRAQALDRLGRTTEAAAAYREFLELWKNADPGTLEVEEARAALRRLKPRV